MVPAATLAEHNHMNSRSRPRLGASMRSDGGQNGHNRPLDEEGDRGFRVPIANLAEEQSKYASVFVYIFAWPTPVMGGRLGACHGLEIPFVFNSVDHESVLVPSMTPAMEGLSLSMHAAWAAFARTGDPNHDGLPEWPKYETPARPTMVFDEENSLEMNPYGEELAFWD
jgi:para-nitrobenzyl esterase